MKKFPHLYKLSNSSTVEMGVRVRLMTKTMPLSFSRTGSLGAYTTLSARNDSKSEVLDERSLW